MTLQSTAVPDQRAVAEVPLGELGGQRAARLAFTDHVVRGVLVMLPDLVALDMKDPRIREVADLGTTLGQLCREQRRGEEAEAAVVPVDLAVQVLAYDEAGEVEPGPLLRPKPLLINLVEPARAELADRRRGEVAVIDARRPELRIGPDSLHCPL